MLSDAALFITQAVCGFFAGVLLLRFWLQWCRAATRNPLSEFVQALTNFAVRPVRRVIPGLWGWDLASLTLAWLVLVVETALILVIKSTGPVSGALAGVLLLLALVALLRLAMYLAIGLIIVMAVMSWINPASPMYPLVNTLTRPLLRPIQRVVPMVGPVDLSPLIALLILQLMLMVPLPYLERLVATLI